MALRVKNVLKELQIYILIAIVGGAFTLYQQIQDMKIEVDRNKSLRRELCKVVLRPDGNRLEVDLIIQVCLGRAK